MSLLRSLEEKIEGLVEGAFSRAFKTHVQPVELARKLAKEMEEHKTVSVSRVYVPNHYVVFLSEDDREQFQSYEVALKKELSDYLLERARGGCVRPPAPHARHRPPAQSSTPPPAPPLTDTGEYSPSATQQTAPAPPPASP